MFFVFYVKSFEQKIFNMLPRIVLEQKANYFSEGSKFLGCFPESGISPESLTMVLWLTQPLTEMSTRNLPGVKGRYGA
jgi:hypothetical protein